VRILACTALLLALAVLLPSSSAPAQNLPDAPYLSATTVHNYSPSYQQAKSPHKLDWGFLAIHGIYAAALASDLSLTSIGVSHHCEEASQGLGPYPSTGRIVGYGLAEFAVVTVGDYGLKKLGRHLGAPQWMQNSFGSLGAGIGTFKHTRGSMAWTRTNCL